MEMVPRFCSLNLINNIKEAIDTAANDSFVPRVVKAVRSYEMDLENFHLAASIRNDLDQTVSENGELLVEDSLWPNDQAFPFYGNNLGSEHVHRNVYYNLRKRKTESQCCWKVPEETTIFVWSLSKGRPFSTFTCFSRSSENTIIVQKLKLSAWKDRNIPKKIRTFAGIVFANIQKRFNNFVFIADTFCFNWEFFHWKLRLFVKRAIVWKYLSKNWKRRLANTCIFSGHQFC